MARDLVLNATVPTNADRVWQALTTDVGLAEWFWPMWPDTDYRFEPVVGSYWAIRSDSQDVGVSGQVKAVEPGKHLEYTWLWDGPERRSEDQADYVTIDVEPADMQTLVTLTHRLFDEADAPDIEEGWSHCLARLEKIA